MLSTARKITVLLVSQPGIMRNTLFSILHSFPNVLILSATGALTAYDLLEREPADVVVIDANLPLEEREALLGRAKKQFPGARTLVLTTTTKHHWRLKGAGADCILLHNSSRKEIETAVLAR
jgi:DNA-binding NarL/FixJ family response regulator